jgi:hypothetical protein
VVSDPVEAVDRAIEQTLERDGEPGRIAAPGGAAIDFIGNYTAFADARARL